MEQNPHRIMTCYCFNMAIFHGKVSQGDALITTLIVYQYIYIYIHTWSMYIPYISTISIHEPLTIVKQVYSKNIKKISHGVRGSPCRPFRRVILMDLVFIYVIFSSHKTQLSFHKHAQKNTHHLPSVLSVYFPDDGHFKGRITLSLCGSMHPPLQMTQGTCL